MDIWSTDKLVLFLAFVIPGFVSIKVYELVFPGTTRPSSQQLIDAVAYSCINYGALFWAVYLVESVRLYEWCPFGYFIFYGFLLLVAPVIWVLLLKVIRSTKFIQGLLPHPTENPWDYVFGQTRKHYWVIATLHDGQRIAGLYGSSSFASSAPSPPQLYLEQVWVLNEEGGFERPRVDSAGVLIVAGEIETVELFNVVYEDIHE